MILFIVWGKTGTQIFFDHLTSPTASTETIPSASIQKPCLIAIKKKCYACMHARLLSSIFSDKRFFRRSQPHGDRGPSNNHHELFMEPNGQIYHALLV